LTLQTLQFSLSASANACTSALRLGLLLAASRLAAPPPPAAAATAATAPALPPPALPPPLPACSFEDL
jgi:hypothetical protein